jgi:ABC-type amino acid transport substrate-binding protein
MNDSGFFLETWVKYHKTLPIPVPNDCESLEKVPIETADESLKSVIERGTLRIAVSPLGAGYPFLYSTANGMDSPSIDLSLGSLDGYEVACAEEGTRRLGDIYGVDLKPEYVVADTNEFLASLTALLNEDKADVVWTGMNYIPEREEYLDFTCNSFTTELLIVGSDKVGSARPNPNGPAVQVVCNGSFCSYPVPIPFEHFVYEEFGGTPEMLKTLVNETDPYEYALCPYELLADFKSIQCPTCTEIEIDPVATILRKPGTKLTVRTKSEDRSSDEVAASVSSSTRCEIIHIVTSTLVLTIPVLLFWV